MTRRPVTRATGERTDRLTHRASRQEAGASVLPEDVARHFAEAFLEVETSHSPNFLQPLEEVRQEAVDHRIHEVEVDLEVVDHQVQEVGRRDRQVEDRQGHPEEEHPPLGALKEMQDNEAACLNHLEGVLMAQTEEGLNRLVVQLDCRKENSLGMKHDACKD